MSKRWISVTTSLVLTILSTPIVFAASPTSSANRPPSGITVSPAFQQIQILSNETIHKLEFTITNNRPTTETIQLSTEDFNALSESGGLFFVGTNPTQLQKQYGLAKWLSLPQSSLTIAPKQTVTVEADILNQPSLSAGGHYGAIMLALNSENVNSTGNNTIGVNPIASTLLFVNKLGGDMHRLKLSKVYDNHSPFALPSSVTLRFYNDGNTHLIPRGTVTITSPAGKVVSQGIINQDSDLILPQLYRSYSIPLNEIAQANTPGYYKLTVDFRFDGYDQFRVYQSSIFLATPGSLVIFAGCILVAIGVGSYYLKVRIRSVNTDTPTSTKKPVATKKTIKVVVKDADK